MVIAKEPIRFKLMAENKIIEQITSFKYLGANNGDVIEEVRRLVVNAARISGQLRDVIWRKEYMTMDGKIRIN